MKNPKANLTLKFSLFTSNKGMTLVEMLVSLTILMFVLGAVFSILNLQQTKSVNVQTSTVMQTDAQLALTLLRWDLFMAGYGMSIDDHSVTSNNSAVTSDQITLRGAGLCFETDYTDWAPVLKIAKGIDEVIVYRFNDTMPDFKVGDGVIIVDQQKELQEANLTILQIDSITHSYALYSLPAFKLKVNRNVDANMGSSVFTIDTITYMTGINYTLVNNQLQRGNEVFLDNIEDIQFAYGVDLNNNGTFEPGEWFNDLASVPGYTPSIFSKYKTAVRATFVVLSDRRLTDYTYPQNSITIEDHTYNLTDADRKYKRQIISAITWPRNLRY